MRFDMAEGDAVVAPEAVRVAWATLRPAALGPPDTAARAVLQNDAQLHGRDEVVRGLVLLCGQPWGSFVADQLRGAGEDPVHLVLPAAVNRLRNTTEISESSQLRAGVSTAAAVLTTGLTGEDAVAWWDRHVPQPTDHADLPVLTHLATALMELIDNDQPGQAYAMLGELLA
jgi:hypothetical protein